MIEPFTIRPATNNILAGDYPITEARVAHLANQLTHLKSYQVRYIDVGVYAFTTVWDYGAVYQSELYPNLAEAWGGLVTYLAKRIKELQP